MESLLIIFVWKFQKPLQIIAQLSQVQSNFNSVGWAELALISTFTYPLRPPKGKYQ